MRLFLLLSISISLLGQLYLYLKYENIEANQIALIEPVELHKKQAESTFAFTPELSSRYSVDLLLDAVEDGPDEDRVFHQNSKRLHAETRALMPNRIFVEIFDSQNNLVLKEDRPFDAGPTNYKIWRFIEASILGYEHADVLYRNQKAFELNAGEDYLLKLSVLEGRADAANYSPNIVVKSRRTDWDVDYWLEKFIVQWGWFILSLGFILVGVILIHFVGYLMDRRKGRNLEK